MRSRAGGAPGWTVGSSDGRSPRSVATVAGPSQATVSGRVLTHQVAVGFVASGRHCSKLKTPMNQMMFVRITDERDSCF